MERSSAVDEVIREVEKFGSIVEVFENKIRVIFYENPDKAIQELRQKLSPRGIIFKVTKEKDYFVLTFAETGEEKNNVFIPILLLILTIFTTLIAGALQQGYVPWQNWSYLWKGAPFSFAVILILGGHELSHFIAAKKNGVKTTFPYFIPFPNPLIGTMGAFIRVKSPITDRKALIEMGASGPIASFLIAIPFSIYGLMNSKIVELHEGNISLGTPIIFQILSKLTLGNVPKDSMVLLHPVAFAGWLGFFVTALNLIPVGQLDGGHILFGIFGKKAHYLISRILILILLPLGFLWNGWWTWAILLLILGSRHPAPLYWEEKLPLSAKYLAIASLLIFILCFVPVPIKVVP